MAKINEELYENTPHRRNSHKRLGDGWLMATYIGKRQQKIILEIAAEVAGLTLGRHIVVDFRSWEFSGAIIAATIRRDRSDA